MENSEGGLPHPSYRSLKDKVTNLWSKWRLKQPNTIIESPQVISSPITLDTAGSNSNESAMATPTNTPIDLPTIVEDETQDQLPHTYVGLERLDQIEKDEQFFEGALKHVKPEVRENLSAKLTAMRAEREELFKKYGIGEILEADRQKRLKEYGTAENFTDAKTISRVLINHLANQLPPMQKEYIRMYRGEGPHPGVTDDAYSGTWFAHDLNIATSYPIGSLENSRLVYVDIPKSALRGYLVDNKPEFFGAGKGGEYHLPREVVAKAKELARFLKTNTSNDPWDKTQISDPNHAQSI